MGRVPLSKMQKEANRKEQVKRYASKSEVRTRMQQYARARRRELKLNRLTTSGNALMVFIDQADRSIQETSEPVVENGAVIEENPDPVASFDYDDDQHGGFAGFDDDYDDQGGAFGGFDEDYDDDFALNSTRKGITSVESHRSLEPEIKQETSFFETRSSRNQILIDLTLDSDQGSESESGSPDGSRNEDMRDGTHDDSDGDSAAESSILDFQDWRAIMAEAKHDHDAQITNDEAYPRAVGIVEPESPLQHVAGRSSSISEIDEADKDEERSTRKLSPTEKVAKLLVEHWIRFKGCENHTPVQNDTAGLSMQEFIERRNDLLQRIYEFNDPDFAQPGLLPINARLGGDPKNVQDQWEELCRKPLNGMTEEEWNSAYPTIQQVFTGPYPRGDNMRSEDEHDGDSDSGFNEMIKTLEIGKGDMTSDGCETKRRKAQGVLRLDIDSILALFTDLSIIKTVLSISIVPLPTKNLQSDVHIIHNGVPLHWIPHFHFGRFGHDPTFDLFIFLPALYNKRFRRRKNNFFNHVTEDIVAEFMNKCFLPAVKEVLSEGEAQEWDFDYELNKAKSNAVGLEGHIHSSDRDRFRQQLHFNLDGDHVAPVWKICRRRLSKAMSRNYLLKAFEGFQFFIDAKNFKYRTGSPELPGLIQAYESKIAINFDDVKIDRDRFWLDVGIMVVPDPKLSKGKEGLTWMWRHCCLQKVAEAFAMKGEKGSKIIVNKYHWCLTRDVGNMTIAGPKGSMIRRGGLMYSQFYMNNKRLYEAAKNFPWNDGDDTMVVMVLDPTYREALRATMGSKAVDDEMCRRSYNHSGRRYIMASRLTHNQCCSAREEHRMSLTLFEAVMDEWNRQGDPQLRPPEDRNQYFVHSTATVNTFSEMVTLPIASWYQATLGMAARGMLGIDRQKLAVMQCFLLKAAWGNAPLSRSPLLWTKKHRGEDDKEVKVGLGLKESIEKFGFGWLPNELFDWKGNTFAAGMADQFPFPIRQLENHYQRRKGERTMMTNVLQEMDQIAGRINVLDSNHRDQWRRTELLNWTSTRIMRQYHQDFWTALYKSPHEFQGKERERKRQQELEENSNDDAESDLDGSQPHAHRTKKRKRSTIKTAKVVKKNFANPPGLIYSSVKAEIQEDLMPAGMGKAYSNRGHLFELIFETPYEDIAGQGWQDKPYLHCLRLLQRRLKSDEYDTMIHRLRHLFTTRCHCIHVISRDRWLERAGRDKNKPGWIAFGRNGQRLDCSSHRASVALENGSSWLENRSMEQERYWNVKIEDILERVK